MSHRSLRAAVVGALALSAALPAAAPAAPTDLKVMTRNLYLGADLIPLATAQDREAFEQAAGQRFQTVLDNAYPMRAKALAGEIARTKPDVIGVQEAAVWRRSPNGVKDGSATRASEVVYDSVAVLLGELSRRGVPYKAVRTRAWFDFEAPTARGHDVRLTQNDVILVRTGKGARVKVSRSFARGFSKTFEVPTQVGPVDSPRGWVGIDGTLGSKAFRFVTTHLEAYSPEIAETQMKQMLRRDLASKKRRSILVGDFNADPRKAGTDDRGATREPNAYVAALAAGFVNPLPRRETCCFAEDLRATGEALDSWIDHVVVRPRMRVLSSSIVGSRASDRRDGLFPSDHAGIVATLRLK